MRPERVLRLLGLAWVLALLGACASTPVNAWERGRLARWDMQWDPDPLKTALKEHTHFSKEGTSGRVGAAGGGCGCN
jgi:hypothetical protein